MKPMTRRASSDALDPSRRDDWDWSQAQMKRVRSAFGLPAIRGVPRTSRADDSLVDRGIDYARRAVYQMVLGVTLPFIGARYIRRHTPLWKWAISPVIVSSLVIAAVVGASIFTLGAGATSLLAAYELMDGWMAGAGVAAVGLLGMLALLMIVVVGGSALTFGLVGLCGPFFEFLAEAAEDVEAELLWTDWSTPEFSLGVLARNLLITAVSWMFFFIVCTVVTATSAAIPVVGWVLGPLMFLAAQGWIATGEYIGTVRLWTIREKLGVIKSYPWLFIGCGFLTTTLSVLIPFVALPIVIPCSVVGFTLTLVWLQHEDVPLPEDRRLAETMGRVEVF